MQQIHSSNKSRIGFSVIELMVVVTIIGITASFAIPSYRAYIFSSRIGAVIAALSEHQREMELYALESDGCPANLALFNQTNPMEHVKKIENLVEVGTPTYCAIHVTLAANVFPNSEDKKFVLDYKSETQEWRCFNHQTASVQIPIDYIPVKCTPFASAW